MQKSVVALRARILGHLNEQDLRTMLDALMEEAVIHLEEEQDNLLVENHESFLLFICQCYLRRILEEERFVSFHKNAEKLLEIIEDEFSAPILKCASA